MPGTLCSALTSLAFPATSLMTTDTVTLFLAILAVVAEVGVVIAAVAWLGRRWSSPLDRFAAAAADNIGPQALGLAFAVATVATAGSLYFSQVAHFIPCKLCWYQRACMYPLVPLLGYGALRRDLRIRPVSVVLAAIGAAVASYHVLLERFPSLETDVCDPANPCTLIWVKRFGYLTIPAMALSGFLLILTLLALARDDNST